MRVSSWLWTALALLLIAGGSYGLYEYLRAEPLPPQVLYGNGYVEGTEVRVSAEATGRVLESRLVEGATVTRGEILVVIDATELQLQEARAEAEIDALVWERERADSELQIQRHHLATAESEVARYRELAERGTASPERLEQAEDALQEALGGVDALQAGVAAIDGRIAAARLELDLIEYRITRTEVVSPIDATVIAEAVEPGELVQSGQTVAVLVDLSDVELRVFVPERDLGKIVLGAPARVRVDSFPEHIFDAGVARVDQRAQFTPRDIHMPEERVQTVFGVTLSLANPDGVLKPGMPADAWILWQPEAGWPEALFVPQ